MCILLDQALDQWNSLVEREEKEAYKVRSPSLEQQQHDGGQLRPISCCPTVWREKICEWCFQVVDHVNIDRDVVSIGLSYFDRYLSNHTSIPETLFQLVAMTSLYLAVKINSTRKISVSSMSSLSKGQFRVDQILKMEAHIIKTLNWHLNPPTASAYLNIVIPMIDASAIDAQASYEILELSRYLVELSVCDSYFADKKPSSIAYASVMIAMENLSASPKTEQRFASYNLDMSPSATEQCAERIHHVYSLATSPLGEEGSEAPRAGSSPTSVFQT